MMQGGLPTACKGAPSLEPNGCGTAEPRVRAPSSTAAPSAVHPQAWPLWTPRTLNPPQGYGLTECCAGAAIALADDWSQFATNGPPLPCIEFRFESVPGGRRLGGAISWFPGGGGVVGEGTRAKGALPRRKDRALSLPPLLPFLPPRFRCLEPLPPLPLPLSCPCTLLALTPLPPCQRWTMTRRTRSAPLARCCCAGPACLTATTRCRTRRRRCGVGVCALLPSRLNGGT